MIDIHSHIIPEVDDGPPDWPTAIEMCRLAALDGVKSMVATPHMLDGLYNVDRQLIIKKVAELQTRLGQENIDLEVLPGADVHIDFEFVELLRRGELLTINDTGKYILVEFPHEVLPRSIENLLFSIQVAGVIPIITHPERHSEVQRKIDIVYRWVEAGNLIQVTAASMTGEMGKAAKQCSLQLLKAGLVHLVASDAHSSTWRPPGLSKARQVVTNLVSEELGNEIFVTRPQLVIEGKDIDIPMPEQRVNRSRKTFFDWKIHFPWKRRHP